MFAVTFSILLKSIKKKKLLWGKNVIRIWSFSAVASTFSPHQSEVPLLCTWFSDSLCIPKHGAQTVLFSPSASLLLSAPLFACASAGCGPELATAGALALGLV